MKAGLMPRFTLVTGASEGIGRELASQLAAAGHDLILVARREAELQSLASDLRANHSVAVMVMALDLSRPEGTAELLAKIQPIALETAALAAGFGGSALFGEESRERVRDMIELNITSVSEVAHALAPGFKSQGGNLVLFSSLVGFQGTAHSALYAATKNFVQALGEGIRVEGAGTKMTTLIVAPGPVKTGFAREAKMSSGGANATAVAKAIVANIGKSKNLYPGAQAKFLTRTLALAPRPLRIRLLSAIMSGLRS
jgi:short-subunit dehydrogenase